MSCMISLPVVYVSVAVIVVIVTLCDCLFFLSFRFESSLSFVSLFAGQRL